jgi:L-ascorbate metabolism protein UlaG (beta-lactamase superfamily)
MLKTTLIAHASMLIQSKETTILTDPVWFDYLWEGLNVLCPSIELNKNKIPSIDILNLSHRHQDHFDVRTLAYLIKNKSILRPDTVVFVPKDEILIDVLRELEFHLLVQKLLYLALKLTYFLSNMLVYEHQNDPDVCAKD